MRLMSVHYVQDRILSFLIDIGIGIAGYFLFFLIEVYVIWSVQLVVYETCLE